MRVLDLFSGIGGFALGLERAGMQTVGFCEIEEFPRKVLRKHWPNVPIFEDVRNVSGELVSRECGHVDLICGGFPCQDISVAGKGAGLEGSRSGLYWEIHRLATEIRPTWLLLENVPALRTRGADDVLLSLAEAGYTAWPFVVGAWSALAPHRRDRVWIVAFRAEVGCKARRRVSTTQPGQASAREWQGERLELGRGSSGRIRRLPNPQLLRVDDGFPTGLDIDRIGALGNSVVPQVVEAIGRAIMEAA